MEGKIIKVQINVTKGEKPVEVESCVAQEGVGIQGDRHIGCGARDVCICRKEIVDWMEAQEIKGLCFARHKENLLIEGYGDNELIPGKILQANEVTLEISDFPKHCYPEMCDLAKAGIKCHLRQEYQMARIVKSGTIHQGETVSLQN